MYKFKKAIIFCLTLLFYCSGIVSVAEAVKPVKTADTLSIEDTAFTAESSEMVMEIQLLKKIVIFYEEVTLEEKNQYVSNWEPYGVSLVMDLPFINAMVFSVPDTITSVALADDWRIAGVEDDGQQVTLQAVSAASDGGSVDGDSPSFITSVEFLPGGEYPWGTLRLYDHSYDPWSLTYVYDYLSLNELVINAFFSQNMYSIRVAIFDTGVDITHQQLKKKIAGGVDLVNMTDDIPVDDNGHGTHVAGTLCGTNLGIIPYIPIQLYVVKVLDENAAGNVSSLVMELQWAIDNDIDIINMSVAYAQDTPVLRLAVEKAYEAGITMVAAAGNHSNWDDPAPTASADGGSADGGSLATDSAISSTYDYPVMYPAAYPEVIAVGAMDSFEDIAAFSNVGPEVDLLAPGTDILSTDMGDGYGICSGTSMAVPHVTGAVAMMLARAKDLNKTLTPADVETILKQTSFNGKINLIGALSEVVYVLP